MQLSPAKGGRTREAQLDEDLDGRNPHCAGFGSRGVGMEREMSKVAPVMAMLALAATLALFGFVSCGRAAPAEPPPTPALPRFVEQAAFEQLVGTAGNAAAQNLPRESPDFAVRMQQHHDALETYLNAWRRENWDLAQADPDAYQATMESIECDWWATYWRINGGQQQRHPFAPDC